LSDPTAPSAPRPPGDSGAPPINYSSYLALDELLALQRPRSHPEHTDELLFIVVHQASELWFKAILHDIDGLITALEQHDAGQALWRVQRVNALMRIVSGQLSSLEALPPQHFAQFRHFLGTSSGAQSVQFRAIEAASGLRDPHFMHALEEHGEVPALVRQVLTRPPLQDLFLAMLDAQGVSVDDLFLGPGPTIFFFLAEALLEYEQQFAQWRFKHVQLVERVIGPSTGGTGGTLGSRYLMRTIDQRFFPKLWDVRARLFGKR
jgi:tryptophan 2,3-dioxygenase